MEFLTILLSAILGIVSPVGVVTETIAANAIRERVNVEDLQVRIDNAPSYRLLQGRVDRVRIAGRGVFPIPGVRVAIAELETDPIALNSASLREGRTVLEKPLQAGVRIVLTEDDLTQSLQSPAIQQQVQNISLNLLGGTTQRYDFVNPQIDLLPNDRIRLQFTLQNRTTSEQLRFNLETGLTVIAGRRFQFVDPIATLNEDPIAPFLIQGLAQGITRRFDLQNFTESGITARVLQLKIENDELAIAAFLRYNPATNSEN